MRLLSFVVLVAASAVAAEPEALVENVAVRGRLFPVEGRWEAGASVGFTLLSRLTDHYNFNASVAFNLKEWLAFEVRGGYAFSTHTALAADLAMGSSNITGPASDAADLWELTAHGVIGARFQPIYGKLNFTSDFSVHFQVYLWAGGGTGFLKRESVAFCATPSVICSSFVTESTVSPLASLAVGARFFLPAQGHSVKFEVRDWSYLDSFQINANRFAGAGGTRVTGVTNLVQFDVGYAFLF